MVVRSSFSSGGSLRWSALTDTSSDVFSDTVVLSKQVDPLDVDPCGAVGSQRLLLHSIHMCTARSTETMVDIMFHYNDREPAYIQRLDIPLKGYIIEESES